MSLTKSIAARRARLEQPPRGRPSQPRPSSQKATIAAGAERIGVQARPRYPDVSPDALARTLRRNELVFACVRVKGDALAKPRLVVERRTASDTYEEIVGHPLTELLARPNDLMDTATFFHTLVVSRDVFPRFVAERLRSPAGATVGLNPLDPSKVKPVAGTDAQGRPVVSAWEWRDGSSRVTFQADELLIWEPVGWAQPPAAEVALGSVDADGGQNDYVRAFFNNAGVPSGVLSVKGTLDQPRVDAIKAKWRAAYGRAWGRQHDIAVLDENATYNRTGANLNELDSETVRMATETRICMAFGVPPLIIYAYTGVVKATYSNLEAAYKGFWDLTIDPLLGKIRAWLSMTLLEEFEGRDRVRAGLVRLRWDTSQVAALQEDEDARHTRARANLQAGITLRNEAREAIGLERDPAGDVYHMPLAVEFVPWDQKAPAEPAPGDAGDAASARVETRPIQGYHIEQGVVNRNEARAALGLPPEDQAAAEQLRQLTAVLAVTGQAVAAGIDPLTAYKLTGLDQLIRAAGGALDEEEPEPEPSADGGEEGEEGDDEPPADDDEDDEDGREGGEGPPPDEGEGPADGQTRGQKLRQLAGLALKAASTRPVRRQLERDLTRYLQAEYARAAAAVRREG